MKVEILYLAYNRLEFTKATFGLLLTNTDWPLVDRLVVYDDGSTDGTTKWLREACEAARIGCWIEFRKSKFRSPPATMDNFVANTRADVFVKIDSDIAVPPGWLPPMLTVLEQSPELELLGMQAGMGGYDLRDPRAAGGFSWVASSHIGGVGAMRVSAFRSRRSIGGVGRQGFTQWQQGLDPVRGWITPDLRVIQLDLVPEEPWAGLADYYVAKRWARRWPPYEDRWWWEWLPAEVPE